MMRLAVFTLLAMTTSYVQADQIRGTVNEPLLADFVTVGPSIPARSIRMPFQDLIGCPVSAPSNYMLPTTSTLGTDVFRDDQVGFCDFLVLADNFDDRSRTYLDRESRKDVFFNAEGLLLLSDDSRSREQAMEVREGGGVIFGTIGLFFGALSLCFAATNN